MLAEHEKLCGKSFTLVMTGFTMTMKYFQFWHSFDALVDPYSVNMTLLFDCLLPLNHKKIRNLSYCDFVTFLAGVLVRYNFHKLMGYVINSYLNFILIKRCI